MVRYTSKNPVANVARVLKCVWPFWDVMNSRVNQMKINIFDRFKQIQYSLLNKPTFKTWGNRSLFAEPLTRHNLLYLPKTLYHNIIVTLYTALTLSGWRPLSYRNQSIDLLGKSMDWFLYDKGLRHQRFKCFQVLIRPTKNTCNRSNLYYHNE